MKIVLTEEEVKYALAVEVFRKTGMRVQPEDIDLKVSIPQYDGPVIKIIDQAILQINK